MCAIPQRYQGNTGMIKNPSELDPALTDERIDTIGQLIARVRFENLDAADERDNGWSIGCRALAWCCSEIIALSKSVPWLKVVDGSLRFIFKIGDVEVSVYKGNSSKPKKNIFSRAQAYPEIRQMSLLYNHDIPETLVWAYAVETDREGNTTNIEFFGMTETGDAVASRTVPIHSVASTLVPISATESVPAELPAAPVSLPKIKRKAENDRSTDDD